VDTNKKVRDFYTEINEDKRTEHENLEFLRSKIIISRYLYAPNMAIADIGGATGAYSFWLASLGHRVHLLDLMEKHIEIAKGKEHQNGLKLTSYSCADARSLPYADNSMDMVLLMGALYHLHAVDDRLKCLTEAFRILKNEGVILCTIVNRYNMAIAPFKYKVFDEYGKDYIQKVLENGIHEKASFYNHSPNALAEELTTAGFEEIKLIAVEGVANAFSDNKIPDDDKETENLLWVIERTESIPDLLGVSRNIIGAGKKRIGNDLAKVDDIDCKRA
jgi:ubiquinone/menaquinone biosynthesis C-methylase UbiE